MIPLVDIADDKKTLAQVKSEIDKVLDAKSYILGKRLDSFERKFASFIGAKEAVGVANGTEALSLSLRAMGIGSGDKVLTVSFTSPFTSIAIVEAGAVPVYCDIDQRTWTIDVEDCVKKIDRSVKAIMPVHIYGNPSNMQQILKLAKKYNLKVIEDACQAHNASIGKRKIGTFGDATGFSFYPTKNLGAFGDAGMITTNNAAISKMLRYLRHGGQTKRFWHEYIGINSRLDEIQAAILEIKLKVLSKNHLLREKLAKRYKNGLLNVPVVFQESYEGSRPAYHLFVIRVPKRDSLQRFLSLKGITTDVYYPYPVHIQPPFSKFLNYRLPITEKITKEILAIPLYPNLSLKDQDYIIETIRKFFKK